jgi:hypothetical protein
MQRISDELFVKQKYDPDKIVAVRVNNGEFYFLAWMENALHYKIQQAQNANGYLMDRTNLIFNGDIFAAVQSVKEYNNMYLLYCIDDNGNLEDEDDARYENEYEMFLTLVNCYERNGIGVKDDHDILMLSKEELSSICDMLRDGDYIFIVED